MSTAPEFDVTVEHTVEPQIITHHIGDVTCILMVPADCPIPEVELYVHTYSTTPDERTVAVDALGLGSRPTQQGSSSMWRAGAMGQGYRATVFLLPGDEDAQVAAS
jgi:hypothetical protein